VAKTAPAPGAGTVRRVLRRRAASGWRVVGWMPVIVAVACHAPLFCLGMIFSEYRFPSRIKSGAGFFGIMHLGTPRPAPHYILPPAEILPSAACRTNLWSPLRPSDASGICDIDVSKTTKGRHMARELAAGAKAPAFTLPRDGGTSVSLKDFKGRNLVLFFYPKADTPGCTKESIAFSGLRADFTKAGTEILGVSADPVQAQDKFKSKHKLRIALGSDESKEMLEAYGAWGEKSMYGRKYMGVIRKTFLIDGEGRIARIWPKVSVPGHAEEVLEAAREL
jgi:peroxiredoxin Q/BCP